MFGKDKNQKYLKKLAKKAERFEKKSLRKQCKPTSEKVGEVYVNPNSGMSYEIIGEKFVKDKETGLKRRTLKIKTNYAPSPYIELPDSLLNPTGDLVKLQKKIGKSKSK